MEFILELLKQFDMENAMISALNNINIITWSTPVVGVLVNSTERATALLLKAAQFPGCFFSQFERRDQKQLVEMPSRHKYQGENLLVA